VLDFSTQLCQERVHCIFIFVETFQKAEAELKSPFLILWFHFEQEKTIFPKTTEILGNILPILQRICMILALLQNFEIFRRISKLKNRIVTAKSCLNAVGYRKLQKSGFTVKSASDIIICSASTYISKSVDYASEV
jgi:hypothetical protein